MSDKRLQKTLLIKSVIFLGVIIVTGLVYLFVSDEYNQKAERLRWLENDIRTTRSKLSKLNQQAIDFGDALKIWQTIPEVKRGVQGLRINDGRAELKRLIDEYRLSDDIIEFNVPEEAKDPKLKADTIKTMVSEVNISFNAITDDLVFQMIEALNQKFPGYIQLKSLALSNEREVTQDMLEQIATGATPSLVRGSMDFTWWDMKYEGPEIPEAVRRSAERLSSEVDDADNGMAGRETGEVPTTTTVGGNR